jgi:hypothetical protein
VTASVTLAVTRRYRCYSGRGGVRKDQDLATEADALNKTVIAFVSKPPSRRSAVAEEQVRKRIE